MDDEIGPAAPNNRAHAVLTELARAVETLVESSGLSADDAVDPAMFVASQLETARRARSNADLLCIYLAEEALERGLSPTAIDWAGGADWA